MIEDYIRWLGRLYANRTGIPPNDPGEIDAAVRVLRHHARRLPREEDFVSLVAEEMAKRVGGKSDRQGTSALPPFLTLLDRSADAVRHRIVREARRHPAPMLDEVPARDSIPARLSKLLGAELSPEENLVVQTLLSGNKPDEIARRLGVSLRTVYRRIEQVRQRLEHEGG